MYIIIYKVCTYVCMYMSEYVSVGPLHAVDISMYM